MQIAKEYSLFKKDYAVSEWGSSSGDDLNLEATYLSQLKKVILFVSINACLLIAYERWDDFIKVKSSKHLHDDMLDKLLNAPINNFFDVQPIGSTLQKFQ